MRCVQGRAYPSRRQNRGAVLCRPLQAAPPPTAAAPTEASLANLQPQQTGIMGLVWFTSEAAD